MLVNFGDQIRTALGVRLNSGQTDFAGLPASKGVLFRILGEAMTTAVALARSDYRCSIDAADKLRDIEHRS